MNAPPIPNRFYRVSKANPCAICKSDHWCVFNSSIAICMRQQSPKEKRFKGGEVGWIHELNGHISVPREAPKERAPSINVTQLLKEWSQWPRSHAALAANLGVSIDSLSMLECVKAPWLHSWGFVMRDGYGNPIGIRIRNLEGRKWAQPGSQAGIFIPHMRPQPRMFVVEGPTDACAGITLGLYAVGRPSCSGGVTHIVDYVKRNHIREVVIVADSDAPGIRGAQDLQRWLPVPSCILILPAKDLRESVNSGIDKSTIDSMIEQLVWTQPKTKE